VLRESCMPKSRVNVTFMPDDRENRQQIGVALRAPSFVGLGLRIRKPNPTWHSPQ
jgi:hypothetical protein